MMMTLLNGKRRRMGETLDACGMLTIHTKSRHPSSSPILSILLRIGRCGSRQRALLSLKTQEDQVWILQKKDRKSIN